MKVVQDYNEAKSEDTIEITAANYIGNYAIRISFNNREKLKNWLILNRF